ncbi:MAG: hypothetical protein NZM12_01515 [Steroidobacteraceae bacterium]|nr:hypothetical protein [Steroidobacteraceae bacterium]MDW8259369.1 hypothetical protein [Gammaproteobacteria bacterium]
MTDDRDRIIEEWEHWLATALSLRRQIRSAQSEVDALQARFDALMECQPRAEDIAHYGRTLSRWWWRLWTGDRDRSATRRRLEHEVNRFGGRITWAE